MLSIAAQLLIVIAYAALLWYAVTRLRHYFYKKRGSREPVASTAKFKLGQAVLVDKDVVATRWGWEIANDLPAEGIITGISTIAIEVSGKAGTQAHSYSVDFGNGVILHQVPEIALAVFTETPVAVVEKDTRLLNWLKQ